MNPCLSHACSTCCHDTAMPLSEQDAARLTALGHKGFSRVDDGWLLLRNERGACVFLRDGKCTVYEQRPEGCKLYPLIWYEDEVGGAGPGFDELCPWRDEFARTPEHERALRGLVQRLVRERSARLK
ncbi:MAG: YkgJ family cysteine cluster protein [Halobacteriales archaeon]|nr:YkgJ family cysteine cluster protein [Halobacteriales archaeon]